LCIAIGDLSFVQQVVLHRFLSVSVRCIPVRFAPRHAKDLRLLRLRGMDATASRSWVESLTDNVKICTIQQQRTFYAADAAAYVKKPPFGARVAV
ncbi:MAG: hypothetical protein D6790_19815, partial [Caldilineae bacterium]